MIDSGTLSAGQHLQIILTKRDEVERTDSAEQFVARIEAVTDRISQDFGHAFASVCFFEIAARDPQKNYEPAYGCDLLFQSWINAPEPRRHPVSSDKSINAQFDLLALNQRYGAAS